MVFKRHFYFLLTLILCCSSMSNVCAQEVQDTTKTYLLNEIEVESATIPSSFKASSPVQTLRSGDLSKISALQVSDAVKFFSGVQVKDYGGVGGLKTVSIRSLGASHTNVIYDGIPVSDYQSGQTDLGRFSLENVEIITLNIGENDRIFQTAQAQALAGALNIITQSFAPETNRKRKIKATLKVGSFGFLSPSILYSEALNKTFSVSASVDWLKTDGNYPFEQTMGYTTGNIVSLKRNNSDVETVKTEVNLTGKFKNGGRLLFKNYYYVSDRGLPSAVIYYTNYSGERLFDRNFFTQANYTQALNKKIDFQANAKFDFSFIDYTDIKNIYPNGKLQNLCYQREYYANATFLYKYSDRLSFSWANDGVYANFNTTQYEAVFPARMTWYSSFSAKYETSFFNVTAKLLNTLVEDKVKRGNIPNRQNHLSPYIGLSVKPIENIPVRMRFFYKNTFRLPTFGDIYYAPVINVNLKPENANQYNLGFTLVTAYDGLFKYISFSGDAYLNAVSDKIVAIPKSSLFRSSVQNYGKVSIQGVDLNLKMHVQTGTHFLWKVNGNYTFQNVLDKTDSQSAMYNQQLPYTPHHSASGHIELEMPWVDFNYTLLYCGKRYYERINRQEYQMNAFSEQGISFIKTLNWKEFRLTMTAECLNLFDEQYEVVRSYPMQGRSFRFGIKFIY